MITHISIEDFATIENMDIDFHKGLNIITGETGAGKSVFLTAMSLALGSRADSTLVRTGSDRALVQMIAEYQNSEVIISREISASGKNICKIDGEIVTLSKLAEMCHSIADIHGQYDNQYMLNPENHIKLVDQYERNSITAAAKKTAEYYDSFIAVSNRLEDLKTKAADNDRKKELLSYQIDEIDKAALIPGEDLRLHEELELLKNKEKIFNSLSAAYDKANGGDVNTLSLIDAVITELKEITTISREASELGDELSDMYYRFEDLTNRLREMRDRIIVNTNDIDSIQVRLAFIAEMKLKYGDTIDEILDKKEQMEHELLELNDVDSDIESISLEKTRIEEMLSDETERLTALRRASAATLQSKIQEELEKLNFSGVELSINISPLPSYTPNGMDKVEFLIKTNVGEPLKPLAKIASGGEMSRIMLAFKTVIGEYDGIPTMIFDEIDSGISGETASIFGNAMSALGDHHQIIAITHLPQIAACADHNYRIEKSSDDSGTYTTITHLSDEEKIAEIARLLAGLNISDITIQNAKEMIRTAR